jgi:alpha-galactosidase
MGGKDKLLTIKENGLVLVLDCNAAGTVLLEHFGTGPLNEAALPDNDEFRGALALAHVHVTGQNNFGHHGSKHTGSNPGGGAPHYVSHSNVINGKGRKLEIVQESDRLRITSHIQFFNGLPVVRCWTEVLNIREKPVGLEYVASFAVCGITKDRSAGHWNDNVVVHIPHHSWKAEFQWRQYSLADLGLTDMSEAAQSLKQVSFSNTGPCGAKNYLPMGILEFPDEQRHIFWQIETHGSWQWEVCDVGRQLYLQVSGPTERETQWWKNLQPGETFISVPALAGTLTGTPQEAFAVLNRYRRIIRRPNADNKKLPVVFNDYMNCLFGDPTTEKLIPLIDKAAAAGAEYFVIDAGWYDKGPWWNGVGAWMPALERFPGGIEEPLAYIRKKGMVPGLWLEIERMGENCPLAEQWPKECFFRRHGERLKEHHSYQLDFRHPVVRRHADEVIRRIVEDYGCGFIKMDFNFDIGAGTEVDADSYGDGLLQHQRVYKAWLAGIFERYPELVIENCSSGGLRMTYGLMDLHSTSSTTDNQNYLMNARISINSATAVCPEQAGVWAYPLMDATEESVIMNMISAMSWRIYLSGQMQTMDGVRLDLIKEAVAFYKTYREHIPQADPVWPLGLVRHDSDWGAFGLQWAGELLLSVWRLSGDSPVCSLPLKNLQGRDVQAECVYPRARPVSHVWKKTAGVLEIEIPESGTARMFRLKTD